MKAHCIQGNACAVCYTGHMEDINDGTGKNELSFTEDSFGIAAAGGIERLDVEDSEDVAEGGSVLDNRETGEVALQVSTQIAKLTRIKMELGSVPALPDVYLWKDKSGQVIYVGKAKQLRARMRQYVNFQDERAKIPLLVDQIDSFDYIVVENEHESLVLEKNLINQHSPFFNADFKDDKSYPFIALTKGDVFPAIR